MDAETDAPKPQRMPTGMAGLDEVLGGGLIPNRLYLVEGEPGTGKTTMALQFLLEGARRGEPGLLVTLSENKEELQATAQSHGWSLDALGVFELTGAEAAAGSEAQYVMFHPSEVELGSFTKQVMAEVEHAKPTRVVFDSLTEMRLLSQDPLRYRRQILALKQFLTARGCTVLLTDEQQSEKSDVQLRSLVHGVIALEHLAPEYGGERRRLRVLKVRGMQYSGGYHDFRIVRGGLEIYPRLVALEHHEAYKPELMPSGLAPLDAMLAGGLELGVSSLIMGPAGVGKSTIATQFAVSAASRGERAAMYIFDENRSNYLARAAGLGMSLREQIEGGRITLQQIDPAELSPGQFSHTIRQAIEVAGVRLIVIDSLNGYMTSMSEERFLVLHLHELLAYLGQQGATTLLVLE